MAQSAIFHWHLALLILASLILAAQSESQVIGKCLNRSEVHPKRFVRYEEQSLNITLETSSRISHQLSTLVFKIFLQEVLGYPKVVIIHQEDNFNVEDVVVRLSGPSEEHTSAVPRSMINLEVWVPPEYDTTPLLDNHHVKECGSIAPPGRFGWFIPMQLINPIKEHTQWSNETQDIHWTLFTDPKFASIFDVKDKFDNDFIARHSYRSKERNEYFCDNPKVCTNGMYVPDQCRKSPCALLLAPDFNVTRFLVDQIRELNLHVKVVWLGDNLKMVQKQLTKKYMDNRDLRKSVIFFSWTPSDVVLDAKYYITVAFKHCATNNALSTAGCKYELTRLVKFSWSKLELLAKLVFESLHRIKFTEADYQRLIQLYNVQGRQQEHSMGEIACEWMRQSESLWTQWIPNSDRIRSVIYIGGIFPFTNSSYTGKGILTAALMAREAVNRNASILPDYKIQLLATDGQCKTDIVLKAFIDYIVESYYGRLVGVLGPACSDTVEPIAGISKHYRTLVISYSAEGASFSDRDKYPYFFRTIGENKQYKHVYLQLFKRMGWHRVAALTEDGQKYTEYISHMQAFLESEGITFVANAKFPRERENAVMTRYLEDLRSKRARIIIADVYDSVARAVMCAAYKLRMTARQGYVWFLPIWLNDTWYNTDYFNQYGNESVNCTTANMIEAINGYFSLTSAFFAANESLMQENRTVGEWRKSYMARAGSQSSNYAAFAYDAVWTYALALDKLIKDDPEAISDLHSDKITDKLVTIVKETDFYGVSGRIKFRGGPSRFSILHVMQWVNNQTNIAYYFHPNISDDAPDILGGTLEANVQYSVRWLTPKGVKPNDGSLPSCALKGLADHLSVSCENAYIILNCILVMVVGLVIVSVAIIIMKKRYNNKVKLTKQYMKYFNQNGGPNISALDEWEIPRESVVINRKLGEGAFGTVYGGEANFPGSGWLAVAVKTLKVGSTSEEKLDFLSEAEVMRRFDHKNIVKLLGVCMKDEPVYTIMEFMLYGDLKTFLLARRHLANDKTFEESEEVSSKKLTSMALDVARGLSYLAELKFVHRDVASRNCLINAQRCVKLGDFGMTRPMFENDYYKFNRKGMLPVRWMAPESLVLGVFTPGSDVWSYGVLLYEIITFGSFPFQGLSNNEVLEHVKNGNTLTIPKGVKPQLEGLLKSCWSQESKNRPSSSAIVEFLATNARLLCPCLDVPLSSVQMEDTGQLEMHLPELRKFSSTPDTKLLNGGPSLSSAIRQNSTPDSGVSIPMERCCQHEPLLGSVKADSLLRLTKLPAHLRSDSGCEPEEEADEYLNFKSNGDVSEV